MVQIAKLTTDEELALAAICGPGLPEEEKELLQTVEAMIKGRSLTADDRNFVMFARTHIERSLIPKYPVEAPALREIVERINTCLETVP